MKMNAVLLFPLSGSLEERSTSAPSCSFAYSTEYGDVLLLYSVFFVICSTHFTSSSSSSHALNATSEELFFCVLFFKAVSSCERPFSDAFNTIDLAGEGMRAEMILILFSHSGGMQVEDMLQRRLKETQRPL